MTKLRFYRVIDKSM